MLTRCPKCDAPREAAEAHGACPTCGLRLSFWERFDPTPTPHHAVDAAFAELQASWTDEAAHDRFIASARSMDALDLAAAHYRLKLRHAPDDAIARRGLEQAAVLAARAPQMAPKGELLPGVRAFHAVGVVVAAALLFAVCLALYAALRH